MHPVFNNQQYNFQMKKTYYFLSRAFVLFLVFSIFVSCSQKKQKAPPLPEIPVVKVLQKDVPIYKDFVGQVYGYSDIPIRARVTGFLTGIYFEEGFAVNKGQLLYWGKKQDWRHN